MSLISIPSLSAYATAFFAVIGFIYQRRKYAASIVHQLGLETFTTYVRHGIGYRLVRYLRPRAAARLSLRDFALNRLAASPTRVHIPAAVPVDLPLDRMFVPLTALSLEQDRVSAEQIGRGSYQRVLLVGDPGSGKSTLVRRIYRDTCRRAIISASSGQIPVVIELKNLNQRSPATDEENGTLFDIVKRQVVSVHTYSGDNLFESFLDDGRLIVLLDGLDEVRTDDFESVSNGILNLSEQLASANTRNRLVVTTRRQLYVNLPNEITSAFESHLTLEPFTADDMYEFLQRWPFKSRPGIEPRRASEEVARIFRNLASQPNIRSMCETPLILAMYVATDQITGGESLPETRPDFYKAVTDELLVRRSGRQMGLSTGLNLLRRNRQRILGRLALEHILDRGQSLNTLNWDKAVKIVQAEEHLSSNEAGVRLRELSRDTGLFTEERREESLRFIHLTFCEFLAAQAIVSGAIKAWNEIIRSIDAVTERTPVAGSVERFAEVIVFATALETNEEVRHQRIRWAIQSGQLEIALKTILDSQPYDDNVVTLEIERMADIVAETPGNERDDKWLHIFRQVAMTLRDRELVVREITGNDIGSLASFFKRVVGPEPAGFQELFLSYIRIDAAGALEMARSMGIETAKEYPHILIKTLDEPAVLAHALAEFGRGGSSMRQWASILGVGALYQRSVTTRLATISAEETLTSEVIQQRTRRRGWHKCWTMQGTLLGIVFEAACRWPASSRLLKMMSELPIRTSRKMDRVWEVSILDWGFTLFILLGVTVVVLVTPSKGQHDQSTIVLFVSVLILITIITMLNLFVFLRRRAFGAESIFPGSRNKRRNPVLTGIGPGSPYSQHIINEHIMKIRLQDAIRVNYRSSDRRISRTVFKVFGWSPNAKLHIFASMAHDLASVEADDHVEPQASVVPLRPGTVRE